MASALAAYRPLFMVVTFGFLALAFYFTYRPRHATRGPAAAGAPEGALAEADGSSRQAGFGGRAAAAALGRSRYGLLALNKVMLWAVTVLAVVFLFFPQSITRLVGAGNDEITAEMIRTVIRIEGMTCKG